MAEREPSELHLRAAFDAFLEDAPTQVRPAELAHQLATTHPRGQTGPGRWAFGLTPALAWALLLVGLLLAFVVAGLLAGGWRPDLAFVVAPAPTSAPLRTTMSVINEGTDILSTTEAKPLPLQATCPPGSSPDAPGPADQDRPTGGVMAFDRHAGRIVLVQPGPYLWSDMSGPTTTWTYDVCTNAWQRMDPAGGSPPDPDLLVYDADSDRTLAFVNSSPLPPVTRSAWSYDLAANRWTMVGSFPWIGTSQRTSSPSANPTYGTTFYHDPSGLVAMYDGDAIWAYDVETNTLSAVRQRPDPALPAGSGLPRGKIAFGYDIGHDLVVAVVVPQDMWSGAPSPAVPGETWTFDPASGSWRKEAAPAPSDLIVCGLLVWPSPTDCMPTSGRAVFDEASGLTIFFNRDTYGDAEALTAARIDAWDAEQRAWRTLRQPVDPGQATPNRCASVPPVYDPLNRRIVCLASGDDHLDVDVAPGAPYPAVWAFSTVPGESRWLLDADNARCDVSTLAGTAGEAGAVDGTGSAARFSEPHSIVASHDRSLFVTDTANHAIRMLTADGTVTTFAGTLGEPGFADGIGAAARFSRPGGIALNNAGVLYVADTVNDAVRRIAADGTVTTLAKGLGIRPVGIAVDEVGRVFTGGLQGNVILRIDPDGTVTTVAGKRGQPGRTDGLGAEARFGAPVDIQLVGSGNADGSLAVIDLASDGSAKVLRKVTLGGMVSTAVADWTTYGEPKATWVDDLPYVVAVSEAMLFLDGQDLDDGIGVLRAGRGGEAGYRDGRNEAARFRDPTGIARDASGMFYIVDSGNSVIRTMACTQ